MDGYIAQIIWFAGNFAPANWAFCQGQLMSISDNQALFALIGTTYGGDGVTTFALPNFSGRIAVGTGSSAFGTFTLGQTGGTPTTTITTAQLPAHNHPVIAASVKASSANAALTNPIGNVYGATSNNTYGPVANATGNLGGVSASTNPSGGNQPIDLHMPSTGLNYVICLFGIFPTQN